MGRSIPFCRLTTCEISLMTVRVMGLRLNLGCIGISQRVVGLLRNRLFYGVPRFFPLGAMNSCLRKKSRPEAPAVLAD